MSLDQDSPGSSSEPPSTSTREAVAAAAVENYLQLATRENTRRSYASALRHFEIEWGGLLPATTDGVVRYIGSYGASLSVNTLQLRLSALARWHIDQGFVPGFKQSSQHGFVVPKIATRCLNKATTTLTRAASGF